MTLSERQELARKELRRWRSHHRLALVIELLMLTALFVLTLCVGGALLQPVPWAWALFCGGLWGSALWTSHTGLEREFALSRLLRLEEEEHAFNLRRAPGEIVRK